MINIFAIRERVKNDLYEKAENPPVRSAVTCCGCRYFRLECYLSPIKIYEMPICAALKIFVILHKKYL